MHKTYCDRCEAEVKDLREVAGMLPEMDFETPLHKFTVKIEAKPKQPEMQGRVQHQLCRICILAYLK